MQVFASNDEIGERFRIERERLGLSYRQMAERMAEHGCRMGHSAVQRIEKGTVPGQPRPKIGAREIAALCAVAGISPDAIFQPLDEFWRQEGDALATELSSAINDYRESSSTIYKVASRLASMYRVDDERRALVDYVLGHVHRRTDDKQLHPAPRDLIEETLLGLIGLGAEAEGSASSRAEEMENHRRAIVDIEEEQKWAEADGRTGPAERWKARAEEWRDALAALEAKDTEIRQFEEGQQS